MTSKRGFFEKTTAKARRTQEPETRRVITIDDDNNVDDDDATVPLESDESDQSVVAAAEIENDLSRVAWQHVISYLSLNEIVRLGATCRFLFARVRADVRDIDLRPTIALSRAANIAKFANQCTALHSFTCRLSQIASLPIAVRTHKLVLAVDEVHAMPLRGVAWTEIKELCLNTSLSSVFLPALTVVMQLCSPYLRRLEVHITSFAVAKMHVMPKLVHLALPLYGRHVKWGPIWKLVPQLRTLELANLHIPMEKLPKQLYSLSVSATVYDVASLAEFSQGWTAQLRHLAEQCPDFSSLQLAISIVNLDQILTIMLRLLSEIALPRLEHLIVHFRSDVFKPYVTDAGQAEIREALSRCRARSSSLWHVELHGSHRFGKRSVVDFSSR